MTEKEDSWEARELSSHLLCSRLLHLSICKAGTTSHSVDGRQLGDWVDEQWTDTARG